MKFVDELAEWKREMLMILTKLRTLKPIPTFNEVNITVFLMRTELVNRNLSSSSSNPKKNRIRESIMVPHGCLAFHKGKVLAIGI